MGKIASDECASSQKNPGQVQNHDSVSVSFLQEVVQLILTERKDSLSKVCVVFNNRRSSLFFKKSLATLAEKACFIPITMGMDNFIENITGLEIVPHEYLLFELYDIHQKVSQGESQFQSFEEFMPFAEMMISDFSEIDLYCADAQSLFGNLHDLKEIGEWDISGTPLTEFQRRYLAFYKSIYHYYSQLRERLSSQKKAYSGMAYRTASEKVAEIACTYEHYYFVGFNALSKSEFNIIHTLAKQGIATLYTDGDAYYYGNEQQEAGLFLRRYQPFFETIGTYKEHFGEGERKISLIACPEDLLQAKYAGQLLQKFVEEGPIGHSLEDTAIVLADEKLLVPMLNSIPESVKRANVTMGYPFQYTMTYALFTKLFELYKHHRNNTLSFHHKETIDVLCDGFVSVIIGTENKRAKISKYFTDNHILYASKTELEKIMQEIGIGMAPIAYFFEEDAEKPERFLENCEKLVKIIVEKHAHQANAKEMSAIATSIELIHYLQELQDKYRYLTSLATLERIFHRMSQRLNISFYGEPLNGLQILGMLESRNLDFRRIILISANEGILPSGRTSNTLIPFNIKRAFGLPTHIEKDAVYANHFYRLLQRASEVYILYSSQVHATSKGELSRYVVQVRTELLKKYHNIHLDEKTIAAENSSTYDSTDTSNEIQKSEEILQRIDQISEKGFSPTALNTYRSCTKKFYYTYILGIKEQDELNDDIDQSQLGTLIHKTLQNIFQASIESDIVIKEKLEKQKNDIGTILDEQFQKITHGELPSGRNYLMKSIAQTQITKLLEKEIEYIESGNKITIYGLEKPIERRLEIEQRGEIKSVLIAGTADRIDNVEGHTRIVDYKTGRTEKDELIIEQDKPYSDKSFQVLTYAWIYCGSADGKREKVIESSIYPLRSTTSSILSAEWDGVKLLPIERIEQFEEYLKEVIGELYNPEIPFQAQPESNSCKYCPIKTACTANNS